MLERHETSVWRLPAIAGALLALGYYVAWLVPNLVGFVPLLLWIDRNPRARRTATLAAGLVFGAVLHAILEAYTRALLDYSWLAILMYVGLVAAFAVRISVTIALLAWLRRRTGWAWGILLPAAWISVEWAQTFGDLRMTVDHVAHSVSRFVFLIQFADVVGHYGVGAVVLAVNGLLADAWLAPAKVSRRRAAVALAALVAAVLAYDAWAYARPLPDGGRLRAAIVQPNISLLVKHGLTTEQEQDERLAALSRRAAADSPQLVVWPESARPRTLVHWLDRPETYSMPEVEALARETRAAYLVGVEYGRVRARDDYDLYNAAVLVHPDGRLDPTWAAKVYLVPFAEKTPLRPLLGPLVEGKGGEWHWLAGGFEPGPANAVIPIDGAAVGVLVCYEQMFPDLARGLRNAGANLLVIITNDAWFGDTVFPRHLANAVRLRAIESRIAIVRAANTGISGLVDRRGRYTERSGLFEEAVLAGEVALAGPPTLYDRLGDLVVWLALGALLAAGLLCYLRREVRS